MLKHTKAEKFKVKRAVKCWQPVPCKIQLAQWLINCQPALQNLGGPWSCFQYGFLRSHYFHLQDASAVVLFLALSHLFRTSTDCVFIARTQENHISQFTTHTSPEHHKTLTPVDTASLINHQFHRNRLKPLQGKQHNLSRR